MFDDIIKKPEVVIYTPYIPLVIHSYPIKAKKRKLQGKWTCEDIFSFFYDESIVDEISNAIISEIDKEIIENLNKGVKYV